jgi:hypothetical protein
MKIYKFISNYIVDFIKYMYFKSNNYYLSNYFWLYIIGIIIFFVPLLFIRLFVNLFNIVNNLRIKFQNNYKNELKLKLLNEDKETFNIIVQGLLKNINFYHDLKTSLQYDVRYSLILNKLNETFWAQSKIKILQKLETKKEIKNIIYYNNYLPLLILSVGIIIVGFFNFIIIKNLILILTLKSLVIFCIILFSLLSLILIFTILKFKFYNSNLYNYIYEKTINCK